MKLNLWDILMIAGILQGLIVGIIILFKRGKNPTASITISLILFACALACTASLMGMMPASEVIQSLERYIPFYLTFLIGPLVYFHVLSLLNTNFKFNTSNLWHFTPVILNLIPSVLNLGQWFTSQANLPYFEPESLNRFLHFHYVYSEMLAWLHITFYLFLSSRSIRRHSPSKSERSKTYLLWLRYFINFFFVFQAIWFPFMVINLTNYRYLLMDHVFLLYVLYTPLVIFIYWIGIKYLVDILPGLPFNRYSANKKEMEYLQLLLNELMTRDKLFLDPNLSLQMLAKKAKTTPHKISGLINQHFNMNFNDFINQSRVNEVKCKLTNPKYDHLTIAAIALESGFYSIPTFQRAFKYFESVSPKEYQNKYRKIDQIMI